MSYFYPRAVVKLRVLPEDFQLTSDASKQTPIEFSVMARNVTVNINDHKTADSFTAEIDYKNFPLDPRACRYVGVVIYIQDMQGLVHADGTPKRLIPQESNTVFSGFVDEQTVNFDETKQTVHFEGRDFTALLIDQKYAENVPITLNEPLDVILGLFLSTFKATKQITVENRTGKYNPSTGKWDNDPLPTLAQYFPDFSSPQAGGRNPGSHESYWEIMQDLVHRAGLICFIALDKLVLTTPRNLYNPNSDIKFIYGQNVKTLMYKRKLGRFKGFNILVRSRVGKDVLTAKIPVEATDEWCKSFGIEKKDQVVPVLKPDGTVDASAAAKPAPYIAFPVPNIGNKEQLIRIGQTVYEDYSRQQLDGDMETTDMVSHSGVDQRDAHYKAYDLTQIDIGQPIAIEIGMDDLNHISRMASEHDRVEYLKKRNFNPSVAKIFANTMGKFSSRFYTKSFSMSLGEDEGFKMKINFINIIELHNKVFKPNV